MRGRLWGLSSGLALLLSGCYSSPYYGAQPYGAPGSMYGTPYQQYPGGTYPAPGGTYIPQNSNGVSPTPVSPGNGNGSGVNAPPTFRPDGSNAPAYPGNGVEKPVPRPDAGDFGVDPNTSNRPPASDGFDDSPFKPSSALPTGSPTVAAGPLPGNPSALPMPMPVAQVGGQVTDNVQFGHDAAKYTWLQGIVAYDDIEQSWSILYSLSPSAQDQFGGDLTLAADSRFAGLRNETPVRLEGFVDPQKRDSRGKPVYRITSIKPLSR